MIHKSEWCWDTAEEGQSLRGEAWSGRVCALKKRTPYASYGFKISLNKDRRKEYLSVACILNKDVYDPRDYRESAVTFGALCASGRGWSGVDRFGVS